MKPVLTLCSLLSLLLLVLGIGALACGGGEKPPPAEPASSATPLPTVTSTPISTPDSGINVQTEEEPDPRVVKEYASAMGIDEEEALRRLELLPYAGPLGAELERQETETFAGLWIQHEPEFRIVIAFTENGEETIKKYVDEDSPIADLIELRTFEASLEELAAIRDKVESVIREAGIAFASDLDIYENRVQIYLLDIDEVYTALQKASMEPPQQVMLVKVDELGSDD